LIAQKRYGFMTISAIEQNTALDSAWTSSLYANFMTSTVPSVLRDASIALSNISETPRLDAELLMASALCLERGEMLMRMADIAVPPEFTGYLNRRMAHEPVAYITGKQAFWDLELNVAPGVLIPRSDSETLIEAAVQLFVSHTGSLRILDLGTGSGALLLAALSVFPSATGIGIDASIDALNIARANAVQLGFGERAAFMDLSWHAAGWAGYLDGPFDLILCNPPYIEQDATLAMQVAAYEPHAALFAGAQGLDDYEVLLPHIIGLLADDGAALFEIGYTQSESVTKLAQQAGLSVSLRYDLSNNPRCLILQKAR
jgi:release factor glutamine methyltransferase